MTDINWPPYSRDGRRLLELMLSLRRPSLTRGEVLALADGWERAWQDRAYREARGAAFTALFAHNPNTIQEDAWAVTFKRARASGEWRGDLLNHACNAATDAAIGRFTADWIEPTYTTILERVWHEVLEAPASPPAEPSLGPEASPADLGFVESFIARCRSHGWDEDYARSVSTSPAYKAALRRCREATWAAGRDALARETAHEATAIPTPGGCYPDEATMLADAFSDGLVRTAEAVVVRDLLAPDDFAVLTETWRSHFSDLG